MANQKIVSVENDVARATTTLTDKMPTLPLNGPQGRRAIGPRVTFHFISGPWSSANTYEAYDVVQVEGVSYVAIQPVPTGIQLDNTQYWFKWSEPNAQWAELLATVQSFNGRITENTANIADLQQSVTENTANIADLQQRRPHMVVIGDSYSSQNYLPSGMLWCQQVADHLNLQLHNYSQGGAGFTKAGDSTGEHPGATFDDLLDTAIADNSYDHEQIDYVLVEGGHNDIVAAAQNNLTTLTNAVSAFFTKLNNAYPKSKIVYVGSSCFSTFLEKTMASTEVICELYIEFLIAQYTTASRLTSFWINQNAYFEGGYAGHPNQQGHTKYAEAVIASLTSSGSAFLHRFNVTPALNDASADEYTLQNSSTNRNQVTMEITNRSIKMQWNTGLKSNDGSWGGYPQLILPVNMRIPFALSGLIPNIQTIPVLISGSSTDKVTDMVVQFGGTNVFYIYANITKKPDTNTVDLYYSYEYEL